MKKMLVVSTLIIGLLFTVIYITKSLSGRSYEVGYDRYDSFVKKAARSKDPSICNEIDFGQDHGDYTTSAEESRYFCISDYAVETEDIEMCMSLDTEVKYVGTITQRNKCLRGLALKLKDQSLCEKMTEPYIKPCKQMVSTSN